MNFSGKAWGVVARQDNPIGFRKFPYVKRDFMGDANKGYLSRTKAAIMVAAAFLSFAMSFANPALAGMISKWDFNTLAQDSTHTTVAADFAASGVTVGPLTKGAGLNQFLQRNPSATNPVLRFENAVASRTQAQAVERNVFGSFSLTPDAGKQLDLTTFEITAFSASGTNNRNFMVRYSIDDFQTFTELIAGTSVTAAGQTVIANIPLTVTSTIEFRIFGWAPSDSSAANRAVQYDNIIVNGLSKDIVPEPASCSLIGLGLVAFVLKRRRK
jgi:hypothetical protein